MMLAFIYSNRMQLLIFVSRKRTSSFKFLIDLVSNEQLRGKSVAEQAQVLQWLEYGEREIVPTSATLVYPCMGIMQFNKQNNERAKDELKHILKLLNDYLLTRTYLVGERITLADIAVASDLLLLFQWVNLHSNTPFFSSCLISCHWFRLLNQVYENRIPMSLVGF